MSNLEMSGPVPVLPAETVTLCAPVESNRELPDTSPPMLCHKVQQNVEWTFDPHRLTPSQSRKALDEVASSVFQKGRFARGGHEDGLIDSEIMAPSRTVKIRSSSDPTGIVTLVSDDDVKIEESNGSSRVGEIKSYFSIGTKPKPAGMVSLQSYIHSRFRFEKPVNSKRDTSYLRSRCSNDETPPPNCQSDYLSRIYTGHMLNVEVSRLDTERA
jgi:hypothetical protein